MSKCPHGLDPSVCLICKTLGNSATVGVTTEQPSRRNFGRHRDEPVRPVAVYPPGVAPRKESSLKLHFGLLVAAVLIIGIIVWIVAGIVFALLHVVELLLVACAAGWAGYRLGHYRGQKQGPRS